MNILGKIPLSSQILTDPQQDLWERPPHSRKHTLKDVPRPHSLHT